MRLSYFSNGNPYTGKTVSFFLNAPLHSQYPSHFLKELTKTHNLPWYELWKNKRVFWLERGEYVHLCKNIHHKNWNVTLVKFSLQAALTVFNFAASDKNIFKLRTFKFQWIYQDCNYRWSGTFRLQIIYRYYRYNADFVIIIWLKWL